MTKAMTASKDETLEMGKGMNRSDSSESPLLQSRKVVSRSISATASALFALNGMHASAISEGLDVDQSKEIHSVSSTYKAENRLNEKLQKAFESVYHLVFEYSARISSIDTQQGLAIIEADIGKDVEFLEWPLDKIPFSVNTFSTFKLQGYTMHGKERFRFLPNQDSGIDKETQEMIGKLDYV